MSHDFDGQSALRQEQTSEHTTHVQIYPDFQKQSWCYHNSEICLSLLLSALAEWPAAVPFDWTTPSPTHRQLPEQIRRQRKEKKQLKTTGTLVGTYSDDATACVIKKDAEDCRQMTQNHALLLQEEESLHIIKPAEGVEKYSCLITH